MAEQPLSQAEVLKSTFLNLCAQYDQMGEQLKVISLLISPVLNGEQQIVPPCLVTEEGLVQNTSKGEPA